MKRPKMRDMKKGPHRSQLLSLRILFSVGHRTTLNLKPMLETSRPIDSKRSSSMVLGGIFSKVLISL